MNWWEIFGIGLAISMVTSMYYRRGVKAGIKHSLKVLDLNEAQIKKLNDELKSDKIVWST
jgi:ribosomal protein S13|tara:strand:- start:956 stop:1135 length:180 start_codon:yes stop_codon:yes gene_type:complete